MNRIAIIGYGYVAKRIHELNLNKESFVNGVLSVENIDLQQSVPVTIDLNIDYFSRFIKNKKINNESCFSFDFFDERTWNTLLEKPYDFLIWLMPLSSLETCQKFIKKNSELIKKSIFIGSTSAYMHKNNNQIIEENSALNFNKERVQCEELMRQYGAHILRSVGIYGLGRNPLQWLLDKKISISLNKLVNWVHVDDLIQFVFKLIEYKSNGSSSHWIASDNVPMTWLDIVKYFKVNPQTLNLKTEPFLSKKIDADFTQKELDITLSYENVIKGIEAMEL